jgi:hypothetical protein
MVLRAMPGIVRETARSSYIVYGSISSNARLLTKRVKSAARSTGR